MFKPFRPVVGAYNKLFYKDKEFIRAITSITGSIPLNLRLYRMALTHSSFSKQGGSTQRHETNERLEFLGDAILGAVVAEYLFNKYPFQNEGFLTEMRSKIVNREALNRTAIRIGLHTLIKLDSSNQAIRYKSINGNALEALVGAVYLDRGYLRTKQFILEKLIKLHFDLHHLVNTTTNFKSKLIEWAQSHNRMVKFEIIKTLQSGNLTEFTSEVSIDGKAIAIGIGNSKKKAEQLAAERCLEELKI